MHSNSSGRAVSQPRGPDDLAVRGFEHDRHVLPFWELFADLERASRPFSDRADRPDDVRLRQGASAVFAASDRRSMFTVEADQQDLPLPLPEPTSIETSLPLLVTRIAAAVTLSRLALSIADPTAERCEPTSRQRRRRQSSGV